MQKPEAGTKWKHYKNTGGEDYTYEVQGVAIHSETLEEMVMYKMLYTSHDGPGGRKGFPKGTICVRPLSMWYEIVEHNGKNIQRFTQI